MELLFLSFVKLSAKGFSHQEEEMTPAEMQEKAMEIFGAGLH